MKKRSCQFCSKIIKPGGLFYLWSMEFTSGADSVLPELDDPDAYIDESLDELEGKSEQELYDDVYQEMKFVICRTCCQEIKNKLTKMKKQKGEIVPFPLHLRK